MRLFNDNEEFYKMFNEKNEKAMIFIECMTKQDCITLLNNIMDDFNLRTKEKEVKLEYYEKSKRYTKEKMQKKVIDILDFIKKKNIQYNNTQKNYNIFKE